SKTACNPPFVCNTPSPTEVATPITVEITANESTVCFRLGRFPNTGSSAVEMRPFFFFLNCKKPITSPTIAKRDHRSEEHMSELQSRFDIVCRLLLEKKKYVTADNDE